MSDGLLAAMEAMTTAPSAEARRSLHRAVAEADVLVPLEHGRAGAALFVAPGDGGAPLFLAFTDEDALRAWADGEWPHAVLDGRTVCRFVAEHGAEGLVLNPAGPWGGRLSRRDAELVAEGLVPETTEDDGLVARGAAGAGLVLRPLRTEPAPELLEAIRDAAARAAARSCYVAEGTFGAGDPHLVVGVEPGDRGVEEAAREIGSAVQPLLGAGERLDVVALDDEGRTTMRQVGRALLEQEAEGRWTPRLTRTENALEEAQLAARRRGDLEPLLPVLADTDVYLPAPPQTTSEPHEVPLALVRADGETFVPVFSSLKALAGYRPEGSGYLRLSGRALAEAVPDEYTVVLDPGSELAVPLRPEDLARLREVPPQEREVDMLIGEPREEPAEAIEAIRRFAAARPEVRAVYRALLVLRPGTEAEPVIGLELDRGSDGEAVVQAAAEAARAAGIESLAFVPFDGDSAESPVTRFLRERTAPFYTRGD